MQPQPYPQQPQQYQQQPPSTYQQPQPYQQPSYLPPHQGQPPHAPTAGHPQHASPAYAAPPSYLTTSPEAQQALVSKAKRDIVFGVLWLVFGLFITLFTLARFGPYLIVAFGPIGYGIYQIIKGSLALRRHG